MKKNRQKQTDRLTIWSLIRLIAQQFQQANLHYGHGTDNAEDEAFALICHVLALPFDVADDELNRFVNKEEIEKIQFLAEKRIHTRKPLPYLLRETYFAGLPFYVDERVLIPRSPIAELIENAFMPWVNPDHVISVLDLCTGSGCIAIACANVFPEASVDAVELSDDALAVAKINIEKHHVENQVHLIASDLFDQLPLKQYDVIVSNPPYVGDEEMTTLPEEYKHEPAFALQADNDGLAIVVRILKQAADYLTEQGVLIVEVGNSQYLLEKRFPTVPFIWLEFERGGQGVFLLTKDQLQTAFKV